MSYSERVPLSSGTAERSVLNQVLQSTHGPHWARTCSVRVELTRTFLPCTLYAPRQNTRCSHNVAAMQWLNYLTEHSSDIARTFCASWDIHWHFTFCSSARGVTAPLELWGMASFIGSPPLFGTSPISAQPNLNRCFTNSVQGDPSSVLGFVPNTTAISKWTSCSFFLIWLFPCLLFWLPLTVHHTSENTSCMPWKIKVQYSRRASFAKRCLNYSCFCS